jgi:hypothetical protein
LFPDRLTSILHGALVGAGSPFSSWAALKKKTFQHVTLKMEGRGTKKKTHK